MLLIEAVEEIQEKSTNYLSMESIVRKVNSARNQLIRQYGQEIVPYQMDLLEGIGSYPWSLPQGSIHTVLVDGVKWPFAQANQMVGSRYYYFIAGSIGLYPVPTENVERGLTILYNKTLAPLTVNDLNAELGFDMDYDMLIVYGVLKDMTIGSESAEYSIKYESMLNDYLRATSNATPEAHTIITGVEW